MPVYKNPLSEFYLELKRNNKRNKKRRRHARRK